MKNKKRRSRGFFKRMVVLAAAVVSISAPAADGMEGQLWQSIAPVIGTKTVSAKNTKDSVTGSYAVYRGVDYAKQTKDTRRLKALKKAQKMVTVRWICPVDFITWSSSGGGYNSVTSEDGKTVRKYQKGKTYVGIPYSMINHSYNDTAWIKLIKGGITRNMMSGRFGYYPKNGTAKGIDCSYFVYVALKAGGANITYQNTASMLYSRYYKKISKSQMKPGDLFLKNGHVMLYVGKKGGKYAVFEATAAGSKTRYKVYAPSELAAYSAYKYVNW